MKRKTPSKVPVRSKSEIVGSIINSDSVKNQVVKQLLEVRVKHNEAFKRESSYPDAMYFSPAPLNSTILRELVLEKLEETIKSYGWTVLRMNSLYPLEHNSRLLSDFFYVDRASFDTEFDEEEGVIHNSIWYQITFSRLETDEEVAARIRQDFMSRRIG